MMFQQMLGWLVVAVVLVMMILLLKQAVAGV